MIRDDELIAVMQDLLHQATTEKSHYYVASCLRQAIERIGELRCQVKALQQLLRESA